MKRICFFIVSHGKLDCYKWQAKFYKKFKCITDYDLIVYDNSNASEDELKNAVSDFPTAPKIFSRQENKGYFLGQLHAINKCYDLLKNYDYVIHHTCDSFFVNDYRLYDYIRNFEVHDGIGLMTNQYLFHPRNNSDVKIPTMCYGTDVFVFKPSILNKNFWEKTLTYGNIPPELIMFKVLKEIDGFAFIWTRMFITAAGSHLCAPNHEDLCGYPLRYFADEIGISHTHDLSYLEKYL